MDSLRIPLVSVSRSNGPEGHTHLEYFVDDVLVMDMDILSEYVPSTGPIEKFPLVQLLVTPHEHIAVLADLLAYAKANKTAGEEWNGLLSRAESLLNPPV